MAAERNISDAFALLLPYTLNTCTVFIETSILRHTKMFLHRNIRSAVDNYRDIVSSEKYKR